MSSNDIPIIFMTAAEASGDTHAANLIHALKAKLGEVRFVGVGGPRMAAAGCELMADVVAHAGMMFDPIKKIPYYRKLIKRVSDEMGRLKPAVLVPVDSPTLNWHMAKGARRHHVPVMYYVAPQVWAWAPWRIKKVRRLTDHVACLLPFEQEYFRSRGVNATFVGHPLFDHVTPRTQPYPPAPSDGAWRIALLPGSREKEIHRHGPAMVTVAEMIRREFPKAEFTFTAGDDACRERIIAAVGESLPVVTGKTAEVLADSHMALAKSGTVTLETASLGVPMVVFYRISRLVDLTLSWWLLKTKYRCLVNIVAQREMVPEFIPWFGDPAPLAAAMIDQLRNPQGLMELSGGLTTLTETLRSSNERGASAAAAELVIQTMR